MERTSGNTSFICHLKDANMLSPLPRMLEVLEICFIFVCTKNMVQLMQRQQKHYKEKIINSNMQTMMHNAKHLAYHHIALAIE